MLGYSAEEVQTKQAMKWRSTCRGIHIRSSVLISLLLKRFLDVLLGICEEDTCFKEVMENFKKEKIWGFENSMDPYGQRALAF